PAPVAVLWMPIVLFSSAPEPVAVLSKPVVSAKSAKQPKAVLLLPFVMLKSASKPSDVLQLIWRPNFCFHSRRKRKGREQRGNEKQPSYFSEQNLRIHLVLPFFSPLIASLWLRVRKRRRT